MTLHKVDQAARPHHLSVFGALHPTDIDGVATIVLLGPQEPGFWQGFTASPEYRDRGPDPMDRWSRRVISDLATQLGAKAFFPFGGPPYQPFIDWATQSGRAFVSPVGLLVHDVAGLMLSYRGALGFSQRMVLPQTGASPCDTCVKRLCTAACPVDALQPDGYNVPACKADLDRTGNDCMTLGCAVRRACPVSQSYGRQDAQSAFHMRAFK